ncbi:MAG: cation:proton antiporter [Gammaproteobacteria bacterium]
MNFDNIILELVLIFSGAAVIATLFLYLKQPIIVAYIVLGMAIGPGGVALIDNAEHIEKLSHVGIILLLFLIGIELQPDRLLKLLGKTSLVTLATSSIFLLLGMGVALLFNFSLKESLIIGAALMFSSTIVSLKLISTTALHHRHSGEMMISVVLLQDIIAIVLLVLISGVHVGNVTLTLFYLLAKLLALVGTSFLVVNWVINPLFVRFDVIQEYALVLSLGWGLLGAGVASLLGLSYEMGAFIAGVSFAISPVALVIAEMLKPLRDFFLVLFFFSIGASFDGLVTEDVVTAGIVLTLVLLVAKPIIFRIAFQTVKEKTNIATELGIRLGQASEFSLLVAYAALVAGHIGPRASYLIQTVVILSFMISTYIVVWKYPTPIASMSGRQAS